MTMIDTIAEEAIAEALELAPEGKHRVMLYGDEYDQWHIDESTEGEAQLPVRAIQAYSFALSVWGRCQEILTAAVEEVIDSFPEEARDKAWPQEWLRGEITRAQLDARIAGCKHPPDRINTFETTGSRRCTACAQYLPRAEQ